MNFHSTIRIVSFIIIAFLAAQVFLAQKKENDLKNKNIAQSEIKADDNTIKNANDKNAGDKNQTAKANPNMAIGGDFELINTEYQTVTNLDFKDKMKLVYFGFTNCPDICPTDMAKISSALKKVGKKKLENLQPIFITIDPKRDDPSAVQIYLENFHKSFIGLTGTVDQIKKVTKNYKVYSKEVKSDDLDGYLMDHSAYIYLIDKDDSFIKHFTNQQTAKEIAKQLSEHL